jgi:N-acetyl-alpha-D-muramate 1-phosphate uridylyltransferase
MKLDEICAVVLAAGLGTRLVPLTTICPKALVPVGNVPLLDLGLERLAAAGFSGKAKVAVNAHHHAGMIVEHVGERAHLSIEEGEPLGSAGALGRLRGWIDGRAVLVLNADAYVSAPRGDLLRLLAGWHGERVRMLGRRQDDGYPPFGGLSFAGASLIPAADAALLKDEYSHLVRTTWRPAQRAGRLDALELDGTYIDCGTPADYLAANLFAACGSNLIDPSAVVQGQVDECVVGARALVCGQVSRSVLWAEAEVGKEETLSGVIRTASGLTMKTTAA